MQLHLPLRRGYLYLLAMLLTLAILYPLLGDFRGLRVLLGMILVGALLVSVVSVARKRAQFLISLMLALATIVTGNLPLPDPPEFFALAAAITASLFFFYIAVLLILGIFEPHKRVDLNLIYGAVSVYLLIGFGFAFACLALELYAPGSYRNIMDHTGSSGDLLPGFVYYSFVTLTTLGYGDISPLNRAGEVTAYLEAIVGQLYLTILVARLVGMHLAQQGGNRG